ncbi:uncharacterized protein [Antedon mediterranea]|uniref:uncharacterized protein n=1 Tax=Antedon mediterranea TaxID=105859 RepID=UPI003AF902F2
MQRIQYVVGFVLCLCTTGNCLSCYFCTSLETPNCDDPFNSIGIKSGNCSTTGCYKAETDIAGISYVERGCSSTGSGDDDCIEVAGYDTCFTTCEKDECNAATTTTVKGALLLVTYTIAHCIMDYNRKR